MRPTRPSTACFGQRSRLRSAPDLVQEEDPGLRGIDSHGLGLHHLAGGDLTDNPIVGEVEVGEVLGGTPGREKIVGELEQQDRLPDLPRSQQDHGPPVVTLNPRQHLGLQLPPDGIFSRPTDGAIPPPWILVL